MLSDLGLCYGWIGQHGGSLAPVERAVAAPRRAQQHHQARAALARQQDRVKGFALDLANGGPDADDADFKQYA